MLVYGQVEASAKFVTLRYDRLLKKWREPIEKEVTFEEDPILNCV